MRKMSKIEQRMFRKEHIQSIQAGSGLYVYENNTNGSLMLPRATKSGRKEIEARNPKVSGSGQFQGDSYFMSMVRENLLKLVKVIEPAASDATPNARVYGAGNPEIQSVQKVQQGTGLFLYENNTNGTLMLPKPTESGRKHIEIANPKIPGSGRFQGDSYFMNLVRSNALKLIQVLRTPEQEKKEESMSNQKLILDQPDTVTNEGTIEHVTSNNPSVVVEVEGQKPQVDVLLNENPMDDVEILS